MSILIIYHTVGISNSGMGIARSQPRGPDRATPMKKTQTPTLESYKWQEEGFLKEGIEIPSLLHHESGNVLRSILYEIAACSIPISMGSIPSRHL
jgi:hypothetical protein